MGSIGKGMSIIFLNCKRDICSNEKALRGFMRRIVNLVDMNFLGDTKIEQGADYLPGLSAVQIIETSHIALHCFSESKNYMFNIESCKDFDHRRLELYLARYLRPGTYHINALYNIPLGG
jgi:S-adenosylmethionine/arginine decarboxylase-like enzyme